jgi:hypothetical protein
VWLLFRHPVAVGLDGYFYVLQIESLYEKGTLFSRSSTPLVIYLLSALKFLINDSVLAIKLGSLLFHLALVAGVYAIVESLTRSKFHALCGTIIVAASSVHLYLLAEYVANAGGLALFVWGAYFTIRAAGTRKTSWAVSAIICFAGAGLSHRSLGLIIGALLGGWLVYYLSTAAAAGRGRKLCAGALGLALFLSPSVLAWQTFIVLPERVRELLLTSPRLPVGRVAIPEKFLLLVCSVVFLFVLIKKDRNERGPRTNMVLGSVVIMSLLLTINPFLDRSAGWSSASERISAFAYVQLAVLLPTLLWLLSPFARRLWLPSLTVICFAALSLTLPLPYGLRDGYLRHRANLLHELKQKRPALADVQTVIAPHGDQFLITYALGVPAQQRMTPHAERPTAHWLVQESDAVKVDSVAGVIVLNEQRSTLLVPDEHLDAWLRATAMKERFELTNANPHLVDRIMSLGGVYRVGR